MTVLAGDAQWRALVHRVLLVVHSVRTQVDNVIHGPCVLAVTHLGFARHAGVLAVASLGFPTTFLGSEHVLRLPVIGRGFRSYGGVFVGPGDMLGGDLVGACRAVILRGENLGVMIDGRQMDSRRGTAHAGAAWLAVRLQVPILPVAVRFDGPLSAAIHAHHPIPCPSDIRRTTLAETTQAIAHVTGLAPEPVRSRR